MREATYWNTLSRRRVMAGGLAGAAGLSAIGLAGCGDDDDNTGGTTPAATSSSGGGGTSSPAAGGSPAGSPAAQAGNFGGELRVSLANRQRDFDPHRSLSDVSQSGLMTTLTLILEQDAKSFEIRPAAVKSWEVVGKGEGYVFKVDPEAKWHNRPPVNGRAIDAEDVVTNLMRIAGKLPGDNPAERPRAATLLGMEKAEVVDKQTVKITMTSVNASFLQGVTTYTNNIVPREMFQVGFDDPSKIVSGGGFQIEKFDNGVESILTKFPDFWRKNSAGQRLPYFDRVRFNWLADPAAQLAGFLASQIDYYSPRNAEERDTITKSRKDARIVKYGTGSRYYWRFNATRKPFDDARIWKAFHLALDYKDANDSIWGKDEWTYCAMVAASFPGALTVEEVTAMPGWNPQTKQKDIADGKAMLAAAGYPDGKGLTVNMTMQPANVLQPAADYGIQIQSQMKKVFPEAQLKIDATADAATFSSRLSKKDFDSAIYAQSSADTVPELISSYHSNPAKGSRNYSGFSNPAIDAALDKALQEVDDKARATAAKAIQKQILEAGNPAIWLMSTNAYQAIAGKIQGLEALVGAGGTPGGEHDFRNRADRIWFAKA